MKLLYLSCHSVLEYDEVSLFHELGIDVFSPGAYVDPCNPGDATLRPSIPTLTYDPEDVALWHALGAPNRERLTKDFVDRFDAVLIMHMPAWVDVNWHAIRHKPVIWRTIGQSLPHQEYAMSKRRREGLKIVRYSPRERVLENYAGEDALIRFYKDPEVFQGWHGSEPIVITVAQSMPVRAAPCGYAIFLQVTAPFHRQLFGPGNEAAGELNHGTLAFESLRTVLRTRRAYFYTGTWPASYTLAFIEAWMTGLPVVAIGPYHGNAPFHWRPATPDDPPLRGLYEVHELIEHGVNGFCSDDLSELVRCLDALMQDYDLAKRIGSAGRQSAICHFGKSAIKRKWRTFFSSLE